MMIMTELAIIMPFHYVENELTGYVKEFQQIGATVCADVDYFIPSKTIILLKNGLWNSTTQMIGLCKIDPVSFEIYIDEKYFLQANDLDRKTTVFHELTHCMLGIDHSEDSKDYMYYMKNGITENQLYAQVRSNFKKRCKK